MGAARLILGALLFNIILNDVFCFVSNSIFGNYPDDNTLYTSEGNLKNIKNNLHISFNIVTHRIYKNYMLLNRQKCNFICLGNNMECETFLFNNNHTENSNEKFLYNKQQIKFQKPHQSIM